MDLSNNSFLIKKWISSGKTTIRLISVLNDKDNLNSFVKKFINFKTFPYVNTTYGRILENSFEELPKDEKIEVLSIMNKYLYDIESKIKEKFEALSEVELKEYFEFSDLEVKENKTKLYQQIAGGYFGEILLFNILLELGYNKIMSKLYIEWGNLSPTGIDVPCINIDLDEFVFAESKMFKNIKSALTRVYKDLDQIINHNKLDKEVEEWYAKFKMLPNEVREYLLKKNIKTKQDIYHIAKKIYVVGFVIGNKIEEVTLQDELNNLEEFDFSDNVEVIIVSVPILSKDELEIGRAHV